MSWLTILAAINLGVWAVFAYLVWRRRWTRASLAVAGLHTLLIAPTSIAPYRAITEPETFHLGFGWVQVSGAFAAIPAMVIWAWGLCVAVIALTHPSGRRLAVIAIGDFVLAGNFGTFFTVTALRGLLRDFTAQGGEFIILTGLRWAALLLLFFVVPFTYSGLWAVRNMRPSEPTDSLLVVPSSSDVPNDESDDKPGPSRCRLASLSRASSAGRLSFATLMSQSTNSVPVPPRTST